MDKIIMNSRGDIGVLRSMVISFEVRKAIPALPPKSLPEPAVLVLRMVSNQEVFFEVASTDEELAPLVERFRKLFEGDILAVLEERLKHWLVRWHCVPANLGEAVEDIYKRVFEGTE